MAVDISTELETIKENPLGESVAGAIVSALNAIRLYAYPSVDIDTELTAISHSPEGSKIRVAIHDALKKLIKADVEEPNPFVEMTAEEYDELTAYVQNVTYSFIDPMHTWIYSFDSFGNYTGGAKRFNTSTSAADYIRNRAIDTTYVYGVRIGDGPSYYSKYGYLAYYVNTEGSTWPDRIYGAATLSEATALATKYGCNRTRSYTEFVGTYPVTELDSFSGCTNLNDIVIGSDILTIPEDAFSGCTNLETIRINKPQGTIAGEPWGAPNTTVIWMK